MTKRARHQHHRQPAGGSRRQFAALIELFDADMLAKVAEHIENEVDAFGWDQPWRLWGLVPGPDRSAIAEFEEHVVDLGTTQPGAKHRHLTADVLSKSIALLPVVSAGDGQPAESLRGVTAPPRVAGVVLATEGWALPEDDMRSGTAPAEHPRRGEVRLVTVLLRNGRSASVQRRRHGAVSVYSEAWAGRMTDTLARVLSLPVPEHAPKVTVLGRLTALAYLGAARTAIPAGWALPAGATAATWQRRVSDDEASRWVEVCTADPLMSLISEVGDNDMMGRLIQDELTDGDWADPTVVAEITEAFGPQVIFKAARRGGLTFDKDLARWLGPGGCFDTFAGVMPPVDHTLERLGRHSPGAAQLLDWLLEARGWTERPWEPGL